MKLWADARNGPKVDPIGSDPAHGPSAVYSRFTLELNKISNLEKYIHEKWDSEAHPIYVTENGISSNNNDLTNGTDNKPMLQDDFRVEYYQGIQKF